VEYFAHAFELPPRIAKEFLLFGDRMSAERAHHFGMVNRLTTREQLHETVQELALKLAEKPRLGLWQTKQAVNHVEELRGKRTAIDAAYHIHLLAHAQNDLATGNMLGGQDAKSKAAPNKKAAGES